jgi:SAM-dependent methyltransferase
MAQLRDAEWRWRKGGGYYTQRPEQLESVPRLPDARRQRDRQVAAILDEALAHAPSHPRVLELGCGGSAWLAHLALRGHDVTGIDLEPSAVVLAAANLKGAGAMGDVMCGNAFAPPDNLIAQFELVYSLGLMEHFNGVVSLLQQVRRYLVPGGQIITLVPNFQGVNWCLQRLGDRAILETHVVYSAAQLRDCHERAGFRTRYSGYLGFYDGNVSAARPDATGLKVGLYRQSCRISNLLATALSRLSRDRLLPDVRWLAPYVYYVGELNLSCAEILRDP